jgi:hypothetical protein
MRAFLCVVELATNYMEAAHMAVTVQDVREYLDTQQITMLDRMIQAMINKVMAKEPCMTGAGYTDDDVYMIVCYLCSMVGLTASGDGRIRSQASPSGASRSFHYRATGESWKGLKNALLALDPAGCIADLIPPNPDKKANCGLWVSPGVDE